MTEKILLGFEVDTGKEVYLTNHHTVVTGMTQLSGKTTCLEALVKRGDVTAVAFLTKRGERGFTKQRTIQPYFREQKKGSLIDWQYVEAILEATMGERMKFERSWIINSCKGTHSLQEVYENIKEAQSDAKRALDQSVYTNLAAYFEIILPQIRKYKFAEKMELQEGFNVMNLIGMREEMQHLVIESVLAYVLNRLEHVVVVLPEAQKFIPQGRNTPVKATAVRFIQEGATLGNFMWIDTQVTTTVDKDLLKQCSNWIMGYQQERNEVQNVRENVGKHKVKDEDIMSLKLGHFIASLQQDVYHVYVLPADISEDEGKAVAMGMIPVEAVRNTIESFKLPERYRPEFYEPEAPFERRPEDITDITGVDYRQEYFKLITENTELGRKVVELEEGLEKQTVEYSQERLRLETEIENLRADLSIIENLKTELATWEKVCQEQKESIENYERELIRFKEFEAALVSFLGPSLASTAETVGRHLMNKKTVAEIVRQEISRLSPARRKTVSEEETTMPWVNIWLPKLTKMQRKIVIYMAGKYPLELTLSQIAQGTAYSARSGSFNQALRQLTRWKLLDKTDKAYKLAEGPPG